MLCYISRVDTRYHGPASSAMVSRGRYLVPRPLLHHVGLGELPCQSPLIRVRHATYNIPN
jgi:hypothetical protein